MPHKIEVRKLPLGQFTDDGSFWPMVDGENVGEAGRCFWHTEDEARAVAERYVTKFRYRLDGTQAWQG
jgi:hypothetical protein